MPDDCFGAGWDDTIAEFQRVGQVAVRQNLVIASGGNFSARDARTGHILVTRSGAFLDSISATDVSLLSSAGEHLAGPAPSSEWRLHHEVYRQRPDALVVLHLHPEASVTVDALGHRVRQLTLDHVAYVPRIERIPFYPNGSEELALHAATAMQECDCVILGHHGCSVLSTTVADAFRKAQNLEQAARMTMSLLTVGDTTTEFPAELRSTAVHR
ncbi:MAG: class II aldolase/adducin family protein [Nocardioides sp.]